MHSTQGSVPKSEALASVTEQGRSTALAPKNLFDSTPRAWGLPDRAADASKKPGEVEIETIEIHTLGYVCEPMN